MIRNNLKDRVLLVVTTEMGLLIALLYYFKKRKKEYIPLFILLKSSKRRFNGLNLGALPGAYVIFIDELNTSIRNPDKTFQSILAEKNVKEIVYQNPYNLITNVVLNTYKNKEINTHFTLISDGLSLTAGLSKQDIYLLNLKLFYRKYLNKIDKLSHIINNNVLSKVDLLISHESLGVKSFLNNRELISNISTYTSDIESVFNIDLEIFQNADMIFFTQPILQQSLFSKKIKSNYITFVEQLSNYAKKNNINVVFKVHPGEKTEFYERYTNDYVILNDISNVPAEFILENVSNKIIVSMFSAISTIIMTHQHFWLYKLIGYNATKLTQFDHINIAESFEDYTKKISLILKNKKTIGN